MHHHMAGIIILALVTGLASAGEPSPSKPGTPAQQYEALVKEWHEVAQTLFSRTKTEEERNEAFPRAEQLTRRFLELAEKNPKDPIALDALVQVITQEIAFENNTSHPGWGKNSPGVRAIAILLAEHVRSPRLEEACRRIHYGFRRECETFLRTVLDKNPHRDVQGQACLRLAQFLKARLQRLDVLKERPDMARRYEGLFGKDYLEALRLQDRAAVLREVEALFERAAKDFGDVPVVFGGTVGERAKSELYEMRHLSVGKQAQNIEGEDQDGKRFKLSDYRGKVVLLYFWSEY
jgi:hypothetical protein